MADRRGTVRASLLERMIRSVVTPIAALKRHQALFVLTFTSALALTVSSVLAASESPGRVPPQCGTYKPWINAGGNPPEGVNGPGGPEDCQIQSGEFGFSISPHVLHVGEKITGHAVNTTGHDKWTWDKRCQGAGDCFVQDLGGPRAKPVSGCGKNAPTCTVRVSAAVASKRWRVYGKAATVPIVGGEFATAYSSDYFIVDNELNQLSGIVKAGSKPLGGATVAVSGKHVSETEKTSSAGDYAFGLTPGRYTVRVEAVKTGTFHPTVCRHGKKSGDTCKVNLTHGDGQASFETKAAGKPASTTVLSAIALFG